MNHTLCPKANKDAAYPAVRLFWHPTLNKGINLYSIGRSEERQCFFYRHCDRHLAFQSPKSLLDNGRNSLDCRVCGIHTSEDPRRVSDHEKEAYAALALIGVPDEDWVVETRVLQKNFSSVDIWIRTHNLLVMVDGEGHFNEYNDASLLKQKQIDDRFNCEALKQGFNVLRLHYRDRPDFAHQIRLCMNRSSRATEPFLVMSGFFERMQYYTMR